MKSFLILIVVCLFCHCSLGATQKSYTEKEWSPDRFLPTLSVQEHYDIAHQSLNDNKWEAALYHFTVVVHHFQDSPFYADSLFYSALCHFSLEDFQMANRHFDRYLNSGGKLKHFEKTFEFKYQIAEFFREGKKKHLFGLEKMPQIISAKGDAIKIYDEIIAAIPGMELSARALFSKGELLRKKKRYEEGIEALTLIIRRFPKHSLAVDSYILISHIYLDQIRLEAQNPDLIALAQLNLQRFQKNFPSEEQIDSIVANLHQMKEVHSNSLYETGKFYERKKKPASSVIYYQDTMQKYPDTEAASKSKERISSLTPKLNVVR